jgi:hypothetical protein
MSVQLYTVKRDPVGVRGNGSAVLQFDPVTEYEDEMEDRPFFFLAAEIKALEKREG